MRLGKIVAFLVVFLIIFLFGIKKEVLADCTCNTEDSGGVKSCVPARDSCVAGKTATCYRNPDGACNHNILDGASCACLAPGEKPPEGLDEGTGFCVQEGFGAETLDPKVNTALGCVPVKVGPFAAWLLTYIFGIAGGIAFLLMIYGFILISTTGGDPKKAQGARETVSSAITGLIVCIFAVFLLRLIAVNILKIPGIN